MYSGESNGLTIYLDIEAHDHGYLPAKGRLLLVVYNIILLPYILFYPRFWCFDGCKSPWRQAYSELWQSQT